MANVASIAQELLNRVVGIETKVERFLTDTRSPGVIDRFEATEVRDDIDDLHAWADANLTGQELIQKSTRGTDPRAIKQAVQRHIAAVSVLG